MRRLSIIDLSGGQQPIFNETRDQCIVFNGEIYNFLELRRELEIREHHFRTHSDTEVIIHAYEEWGDKCLTKLNGMFAFAIWDNRCRKLLIARDRAGKKPIYYHNSGAQILFGSEIKSLLECSAVPRKLNHHALNAYLTLGYVPAPQTLFEGIHKLPAGHYMTVQDGKVELVEYWDVPYQAAHHQTADDVIEQVYQLLADSVRARLISDVPLGAFLSGGIDSSVVVGIMSQFSGHPINTYSVGFNDPEINELPYARMVAEHFQTNHHELLMSDCSPDLLEKLVWHSDEPVADPAAIPTFLVSQLARQTVKVVLTGEGSDELFGGYSYYYSNQPAALAKGQILFEDLSRRWLPRSARIVNQLLGRSRYHARTIWNWSLPSAERMIAWVGIFSDDERRELNGAAFDLNDNPAKRAFADFYKRCRATDQLGRQMYTDFKVWLADDLLMKVDKMSMAASIEARCPYLDYRLVEFVSSIPAELKIQGATSKFILRQAAKRILPNFILNRKKKTFDVPIEKWLKGSLRALLLDTIHSGVLAESSLFNQTYILGEMWHGLDANRDGVARQFWTLLHLGLWARIYQVSV